MKNRYKILLPMLCAAMMAGLLCGCESKKNAPEETGVSISEETEETGQDDSVTVQESDGDVVITVPDDQEMGGE